MGQTHPSSKPTPPSPSIETFPYGTDHSLQTVTVATLNNDNNEGYWVILIHGGAWRDPTQTATNYLTPALSTLTTNPSYTNNTTHLKGIASISYHHISDVQSALSFLQGKYNIGRNYILVGHSCGATLAFQSMMGRFRDLLKGEVMLPPPVGIVGMAGIYDLRLLRDTHRSVSAYQEFSEGAFGADEAVWDEVSPALGRGEEGVCGGWSGIGDGDRLVAVLAYSGGDSLVDPGQREVMRKALEEEWVGGGGRGMLDIEGDHNDAWEKGEDLARAIAFAIEKVRGQ
ncbi:alpha/beta-hydrolase [Aspergillus eucalypticola CBS 122712]|uniref:Kynurenine formamidase n=1 Tax=Aspergillus eucalypticola (strain CBS 122712 / IBT 29274) TaxID=1448314 RepID=A0A317V570_ASPEC|nr:alpha/beta-hydrolase [Aspergillus eucalypticola CBS 122712]PWY67340.1 alpha/beta-hydrolase [Aspergillus eucalypticola CBS 122712]